MSKSRFMKEYKARKIKVKAFFKSKNKAILMNYEFEEDIKTND